MSELLVDMIFGVLGFVVCEMGRWGDGIGIGMRRE